MSLMRLRNQPFCELVRVFLFGESVHVYDVVIGVVLTRNGLEESFVHPLPKEICTHCENANGEIVGLFYGVELVFGVVVEVLAF